MQYAKPRLTTPRGKGISTNIGRMLAICLMLLSLSVAANGNAKPPEGVPAIETIASQLARFHGYQLRRDGDGWKIRGKLLKSPAYRYSLRGRIRVSLLDRDGRVMRDFVVGHRHFPRQGQLLDFKVQLPELPADVERIRLTHLS